MAEKRTLLLTSPSVAAEEETIKGLFAKYGHSSTDLQMLDRLSDGIVVLPNDTYDRVVVLKGGQNSTSIPLLQKVYGAVVPAMKVGSRLTVQGSELSEPEKREAILSGLVQKDGGFERVQTTEAVQLRGAKKPQRLEEIDWNGLGDDDDELVDEDTLLSEADKSTPYGKVYDQPKECEKRRRPCKDCTCGLAAQLDAEDSAKTAKADATLKSVTLLADELNELDFTVPGKSSSCNNCSLGDAFRCSGCPYLGFPAFKPGEEVRLLNKDVQQL